MLRSTRRRLLGFRLLLGVASIRSWWARTASGSFSRVVKKSAIEEELFLIATEAGAEDFDVTDEFFIITTAPDQLFYIKEKIDHHGIKCEETELQMIPKVYVDCDPETQKLNLDLIEYLEALEDVDSVYHNMKID